MTLRAVRGETKMSMEAVEGTYKAVVQPAVTCGSETWVIKANNGSCVEAAEIRNLTSMCLSI